jgi:serine phosphatase RsbU (regulator of sigma subunit)
MLQPCDILLEDLEKFPEGHNLTIPIMASAASLAPDQSADLLAMVAHCECVNAADALEDVHQRFARHEFEYMAVLDNGELVGLCARRQVGMILGARFGFALHSRKPIRETLLCVTTVRVGEPVSSVLKAVFSRPDETFFDDVVLVNEAGSFQGLIFARTLVRLQHALLLDNINQLESHERELNQKNDQMEEDLRMAREIQQALLPQEYPDIPSRVPGTGGSLRFCHCYHPAGLVSGDFFHVHAISDDAAGVFICDVMGHGVRSAFVTAMLRTLVEELRQLGGNPGELLTQMNAELRSILKPLDAPMFATAFYLMADVRTGQLRYAKAGHPNPLRLHRNDGGLEPLHCLPGSQGAPLGLMDGSRYTTNQDILGTGDVLVFFTDGINEIFDTNEREFGDEGLRNSILKRRSLALEPMLNGVVSDARHFSANGFLDDVCLLGMEFEPAGTATAILPCQPSEEIHI